MIEESEQLYDHLKDSTIAAKQMITIILKSTSEAIYEKYLLARTRSSSVAHSLVFAERIVEMAALLPDAEEIDLNILDDKEPVCKEANQQLFHTCRPSPSSKDRS